MSKDNNSKEEITSKTTNVDEQIKQLENELTSRGRTLEPFWNEQAQVNASSWWLPSTSDVVVFDLQRINGSLRSFPVNSWFSAKVTVPENRRDNLIYNSYSLPTTDLTTDILKCKTYLLYLTPEQKQIIDQWLGVFRWFYNRTIDFAEENKVYNFRTVRNEMRKDKKYPLPEWSKVDVCPRIITGAIHDCCKAYKTGFSQVKSGLIKNFKLHYKTKKDRSHCLFLEKSCFTQKGLLPKYKLGIIEGSYNHKKVKLTEEVFNHDCRLTKVNNNYYLHIPVTANKNENQVLTGIISLDSGVRTFQTGYSPAHHTVEIGVNTLEAIKPFLKRVDSCESAAANEGKKKRRRLFAKVKRINEKIRNKIDDLHWKTIKFLTRNYKDIVVSDFKTSELLKSKKLSRGTKRLLNIQSHYKFRQRLQYKAKLNGNNVFFVDESYTSKTCCNCGWLNNNLGSKKVFFCEDCGIEIDRDVNGARNILNKNSELVFSELQL